VTDATTAVQASGADIIPPLEHVREFIRASKAENTLRGYQSDWHDFCGWCEGHSVCPLTAMPETVAAYIAECASRLKVGSIQRRLNAIAEAHKAIGLESPTHAALVANTMKGIRRTKGTAPAQKAPALTKLYSQMMTGAISLGMDEDDIRQLQMLLQPYLQAVPRLLNTADISFLFEKELEGSDSVNGSQAAA
jgi:hypothetical protein